MRSDRSSKDHTGFIRDRKLQCPRVITVNIAGLPSQYKACSQTSSMGNNIRSLVSWASIEDAGISVGCRDHGGHEGRKQGRREPHADRARVNGDPRTRALSRMRSFKSGQCALRLQLLNHEAAGSRELLVIQTGSSSVPLSVDDDWRPRRGSRPGCSTDLWDGETHGRVADCFQVRKRDRFG